MGLRCNSPYCLTYKYLYDFLLSHSLNSELSMYAHGKKQSKAKAEKNLL